MTFVSLREELQVVIRQLEHQIRLTSRYRIATCLTSFSRSSMPIRQQMNGGEGFVGNNFLMAWPVEDLIQFNKDYVVDEAAPGLFLFGSSGGGEAFAFDTRPLSPPIVAVPFVVISLEDAKVIAPNFNAFLQHLYQSESLFSSRLLG
jgi:hypothetical protein